MRNESRATTLWRPTVPEELDLLRDLDAEELDEFNAHIAGKIELVHEFH
ncbi:hypothetical protein [Streptomyces sp. SID5643]|nr:hypothetical protein [Streptomyces sp. SID5643]